MLGAAPAPKIQEQIAAVVAVDLSTSPKFQQFYEFDILVLQIQFVRVLDMSVMQQRQLRAVPNCAGDREDDTGAVLG